MATQHNTKDETGKRYDRLLVVRREGSRCGNAAWLCRCDCGKETVVRGVYLRDGRTRSCGCLHHDTCALPPGEGALNRLLDYYKRNAANRKYEWNLSKDQFRKLTKQTCHYCGAEPAQTCRSEGNGDYVYNGIDRVDPHIGYMPDNTVTCCGRCNRAKGIMTIEEFYNWLRAVYKHWPKTARR